MEPGLHTPWPVHAPAAHWPHALQVSVSVPQFPQATVRVVLGVHTGAAPHEQAPQVQLPEQVDVP
jgi:hypothetical protein